MIIERIVKVWRKKNLNFHHKRTASTQWNSFHIPVENDETKYLCLQSEKASWRTAFSEYATLLLIFHILSISFYVRTYEITSFTSTWRWWNCFFSKWKIKRILLWTHSTPLNAFILFFSFEKDVWYKFSNK